MTVKPKPMPTHALKLCCFFATECLGQKHKTPHNTDLLIGLLALLHASLVQREIVFEEVGQQVPEHTWLEQVSLQPEVYAEGAHTLRHHRAQSSQVLGQKRKPRLNVTTRCSPHVHVAFCYDGNGQQTDLVGGYAVSPPPKKKHNNNPTTTFWVMT